MCFPPTYCSESSLSNRRVGVHYFSHNTPHCSSPKSYQRALLEEQEDRDGGGVICEISLERMERSFLFCAARW